MRTLTVWRAHVSLNGDFCFVIKQMRTYYVKMETTCFMQWNGNYILIATVGGLFSSCM